MRLLMTYHYFTFIEIFIFYGNFCQIKVIVKMVFDFNIGFKTVASYGHLLLNNQSVI